MSDSGENQNDALTKNKQIKTESNEHWKSNLYVITYKKENPVQVEEDTTETNNAYDQITKELVNLDKCIVQKVTHNTISLVNNKKYMNEKESITRQTTSKQINLNENRISNMAIVKNYTELQQSMNKNEDSIKYVFTDSDHTTVEKSIEITEKRSDSNSQVLKSQLNDISNPDFIKDYTNKQNESANPNTEKLIREVDCSTNITDNVKYLDEMEEIACKSTNSTGFGVSSSINSIKLVETKAEKSSDDHRGMEMTPNLNEDELSVIYYVEISTNAAVYETDKFSAHIQETKREELVTNSDVYKIPNAENQEGVQEVCKNLNSNKHEVLVDGNVIEIIEMHDSSRTSSCLDNGVIKTQLPCIDTTDSFINIKRNPNKMNNIHQDNVNTIHTSNLTTLHKYPSKKINLDQCEILVDEHVIKNVEIQRSSEKVRCDDDQIISTEIHIDKNKYVFNGNQQKSNKSVGNSSISYQGAIKGVFESCNNSTENRVFHSNINNAEKQEFDHKVIEPQLNYNENKEQISSNMYIFGNYNKIVEKYKKTEAHKNTDFDENTAVKQSLLNIPVVDFDFDKSVETEPRRPSIIKPRTGASNYSKKLHVHFEDQEPTDEKEKFLRIIFTILGIMLSITITTIVTSMTIYHINAFWKTREGNQLFLLSTMIALSSSTAAFCPNTMRAMPSSCVIIMMTVASYSIFLGYLTVRWDTKFFLYGYTCNAALIFLCLVLTSKSFDFTGWALYWTAFGTVIIILTICMVVEFMLFNPDITMYKAFVLYAGVILNCAFLIIILQIILGGTIIESRKDDYFLSAFMLYTSTPGFFIQLFRLLCLVDLD